MYSRKETCLKVGMSVDEMRTFLDLCLQGKSSIPKRKAMLDKKKKDLELKKKIEDSLSYLDLKRNFYDDVLNSKKILSMIK